MPAHVVKNLIIAVAATFVVAACAQPEKPAPTSATVVSSGNAVAGAIQGNAVVERINRKTREVTLKRADGSSVVIVAGDEVRNFNQIRVGDIVEAEIVEAVAVTVEHAQTQVRERRVSSTFDRAKLGDKPAGKSTITTEIVGMVDAVDAAARKVTVKGAVQTRTFQVSEKVDLSKIKKGDNVYAVFVETYSVRVRSPKR